MQTTYSQRENSSVYGHSLSASRTTNEMVAECILSANHDEFGNDGNKKQEEERTWRYTLVWLFGKKVTGATPVVEVFNYHVLDILNTELSSAFVLSTSFVFHFGNHIAIFKGNLHSDNKLTLVLEINSV